MPCGGIRSTPIRYCSARRAATSYRPRSGFDGAIFPRMRALTLIHRWRGVTFCLLFAMWFASGIVMHFVPFPELTEAERVSGLAPIDAAGVRYGPAAAIAAARVAGATRMRLLARADGVIYLVEGASGPVALHAMDLSPARLQS